METNNNTPRRRFLIKKKDRQHPTKLNRINPQVERSLTHADDMDTVNDNGTDRSSLPAWCRHA